MDDAYTIGIRMALEDGVSAGVASIAQELAALDRAVAATQAGLVQLGAMAGAATRAVSSQMQGLAHAGAQALQVPQASAETAPPAVAPLVMVASFSTMPAAPAAQEAAPGLANVFAAPEVSVAPAPAVVVQTPVAVPPSAAQTLSGFAPAALPGAQVEPLRATQAPGEVRTSERTERLTLRETERRDVLSTRDTERNTAAPVTAPGNAPVAPVSLPPAASPPAPPASPPREEKTGGPTQGDVYLDGTRLGRWVARDLARAASRPQGGSTFFDPRMGPSWPGTLQGS